MQLLNPAIFGSAVFLTHVDSTEHTFAAALPGVPVMLFGGVAGGSPQLVHSIDLYSRK